MSSKYKNLNFLVVEDNEDDYVLLKKNLNQVFQGDVQISWVRTYEEALEVIKREEFDVFLIDYLLGARDGLELANELNPRNPDTPPIIILTGMDRREVDILAIQSGVADCLFKNQITPALLERAIYYALARNENEQALRESEIRHRTVLNTVAEGIITIDADGQIMSVNPATLKMFGYQEDELLGLNITKLMPESYAKRHAHYLQRYLESSSARLQTEFREFSGKHKNGDIFPLELLITEFEVGGRKCFSGVLRDITKRKKADEELRLAATTFDIHAAIMITDGDGNILRVNNAFTRITGYSSYEVVGKNPSILQSGVHQEQFFQEMWESLHEKGQWEGELWNKRKGGDIYPEWLTITAVKNEFGRASHYVATFQDITERKEAQALIEHQALYDSLTDLPNRRFFTDRLNQEVSSARRHDVFGAVLFLDLDHFKTLNDSLGHDAGDVLLQQVAKRLSSHVRAEDTVARLGGDEFVVLLPYLNEDLEQSGMLAQSIADKLREAIAAPYNIHDHHYTFSPSIGIAMYPFENETVEDIMKHADTAMYKAKEDGRNTVRFYRPSMQAAADTRLSTEMELAHAIERNQLLLHYQPQADRDGNVIGVEALLRWEHPVRGMVNPNEFISVAEETGLIVPIGEWVLNTAMKQFTQLKNSGCFSRNECLAINISPRQFQHNEFVIRVIKALQDSQLDPKCLKLEITEALLLHNIDEVISKMKQLKGEGVSFSIDDFGIGYSSLSYIKQLPLDQIKIDRSFVSNVASDHNDAAIIETIIAMARHFELDVIAEGVETKEVLEFLKAHDCLHFQGYYFSESLAEEQLFSYLNQDTQSPVEAFPM